MEHFPFPASLFFLLCIPYTELRYKYRIMFLNHGIQNVFFLPICIRTLRCSLNSLCSAQNGTGEQVSQHEDVCTVESQSNVSHAPLSLSLFFFWSPLNVCTTMLSLGANVIIISKHRRGSSFICKWCCGSCSWEWTFYSKQNMQSPKSWRQGTKRSHSVMERKWFL